MNWKAKALVQNAIAILPDRVSQGVYYTVQRRFGRSLGQYDPTQALMAAIETAQHVSARADAVADKTVLEVGTGRTLITPLAFYLMGTKRVITVDKNPYLRPDLTISGLAYMAAHRPQIEALFGERLRTDRLDRVLALVNSARPLPLAVEDLGVTYRAPSDASDTGLPAQSIDIHTSFTVFEHIPRPVLAAILKEGNRLIRPGGIFVHNIDYSDHFAHTDASIPWWNFLRYSEGTWSMLAGNRFMYMNRLRHDDYLALYAEAGHRVADKPRREPELERALIEGQVVLAPRFALKKPADVAISGSWIVSAPRA